MTFCFHVFSSWFFFSLIVKFASCQASVCLSVNIFCVLHFYITDFFFLTSLPGFTECVCPVSTQLKLFNVICIFLFVN